MLKEIKTRHRKIIRLTAQGVKPAEIATRLDMNVQSIYAILRDPLAKSFLEGLQDKADETFLDVNRIITESQVEAATAIKELITEEGIPPPTKLAAAKDMLDRGGHKPVDKHEHLHGFFTADDIRELKARMEMAEKNEDVVDVVYEDI